MRTYKFRLYPTKLEQDKLYSTLNTCRYVYNYLLETRMKYDEEADIQLSGYDLSKYLTYMKKSNKQLTQVYSKVLQPVTEQLWRNFKVLFALRKKGIKTGNLRFKSRNRFTSFTYNQLGFKVITTNKRYNKLRLSKIGDIHFRQHRDIIGKIKQVQIKKTIIGWYVYIVTNGKYECKNLKENKIGIDMGILNFLTTSNNEKINNPLFMNKVLDKIKKLCQLISRCKLKSKNRRKNINKLKKLYEKIYNQKHDFFHKISTKLVTENNYMVFEDLNIKNMVTKTKKNKYLNMRNILDSSWSTFINMIKMKVLSTTSKLIFVNPANTSKMCSGCGCIKDMPTSERIYNCECGLKLDRDYNASINIFNRSLGKGLTFVGEGTIVSSMNQEATSLNL